jgi:hypothetical protein
MAKSNAQAPCKAVRIVGCSGNLAQDKNDILQSIAERAIWTYRKDSRDVEGIKDPSRCERHFYNAWWRMLCIFVLLCPECQQEYGSWGNAYISGLA